MTHPRALTGHHTLVPLRAAGREACLVRENAGANPWGVATIDLKT
jgi:hypothetical protein